MHPRARTIGADTGVRQAIRAVLAPAALAMIGSPAHAVAPPDSSRLAELQAECQAAWQVRITGDRSVRVARRPTVDAGGIVIAPGGRQAFVMLGDPHAAETRIPWAEIERIDAERSTAIRATVLGFALGAAIGGTMLALTGPDLFESGDHAGVGLAVATAAAGAGIGLLVGLNRPVLRPLYH